VKSTVRIVLLVALGAVRPVGADGTLDPSFGHGGITTTSFFGSWTQDSASSLALMPDGRAVVAGYTNVDLEDTFMAVARYLPSGALDTTFDGDGMASVQFPAVPPGIGSGASAESVLLQPDGRVVLVGYLTVFQGEFFALARLNADGSPDTSFGESGRVTTPFPGWGVATAAVLQPDGRIVAVGMANPVYGPMPAAARYTADGRLDPTFGTNGQVTLSLPYPFTVQDVALQPDGKLVIAGQYGGYSPVADRDFGLVRLLPDGSPDPEFGTNGLVRSDFRGVENGYSVTVLPDGRLVLGGTRAVNKWWITDFALARYLPDGTLDTSFGTDGLATADSGLIEVADQLVRLPNGNLLIAGYASDANTWSDFLLARFLPDGALDDSFGTAGFLRTGFFQKSADECHAAAIAGPDRILTAGTVKPAGYLGPDFGLARYIITTTAEGPEAGVE
jgi:uncharacterized delta-60 repeat protein